MANAARRAFSMLRLTARRTGIALVNALIFALLSAAFLIVAIEFTTQSMKQGRSVQSSQQVYNVALAGLNAATAWLRQQDTQPVTVFDPQSNTGQPDLDAETPASWEQLGLVRDFTVDSSRGIYGHYEVGRSTTDGNPAPARGSVTQAGSHYTGYTDPVPWTAEDISARRGFSTQGTVWLIHSRGILYSGTSPYVPGTSKVIQKLELQAEVGRRNFNFYQSAAYCFEQNNGAITADRAPGNWFDVLAQLLIPPAYAGGPPPPPPPLFVLDNFDGNQANTVLGVSSGSSARAYWTNFDNSYVQLDSSHATVTNGPLSDLTGQSSSGSSTYVSPSLSAQLSQIFGQSTLSGVQSMADYNYPSEASIPNPMPDNAMIYVNGNCNFDSGSGHPTLSGHGILVINGYCHIDGNSVSQNYSGAIFCVNSYQQQHQSSVTGTVVTGGNFTLKGADHKQATLMYDKNTLSQVELAVGTYQLNNSTIRTPASSTVSY